MSEDSRPNPPPSSAVSRPSTAYPGPGRYVVPLSVLKDRPREAVALVRLGAVANAIMAVASMSAGSLATDVGRERDTQQAILVSLSYIKEACDILGEYGRGVWNLAEKAVGVGYPLHQPVDTYKRLFATSGPLYNEVLKIVRHTKGFHIDPKHFAEWLDTLEAPEVTMWHKDSSQPLDWAFTASAAVQTFFGVQLDQETVLALQHVLDLVFIVEAMASGMMLESGYDPRAGWRPSLYQPVRIEYQFEDGRANVIERLTVPVDVGGTLGRGRNVLLDRLYAFFGGKEHTGFVLSPVDGALMHFHSPRGSASVWPEGQPSVPTSRRRREDLVARLDDAASWGEQQARFALEQLEACRAGDAVGEQVAVAINQLLGNLDYWRTLKAVAEEAKKSLRGDASDEAAR